MKKIGVLALGLFLTSYVYANCDNDIDIQLAKKLNYSEALKRDDSYFSACKVWPVDPKKTIVAFSFIQQNELTDSSASQTRLYDLNVLVVETGSNKILSHIYQQNVSVSDNLTLAGYGIDTGKYDVANGVRAFGVLTSYMDFHHAETQPKERTLLTLFVEQEEKIVPILENLVIKIQTGKWDGFCKGEFSDTKSTIRVGDRVSSGYHDLIAVQTNSKYRSNIQAKECVDHQLAKSRKIYDIKFNGKVYDLPSELKKN